MELKFGIGESVRIEPYVLIVPLWNWNFYFYVFVSQNMSSNRTFMELKSEMKTIEMKAEAEF